MKTQTQQFPGLSFKGWPQEKLCTGEGMGGRQEGAVGQGIALSQEKDTQDCTLSAAVPLHFEIKLKH